MLQSRTECGTFVVLAPLAWRTSTSSSKVCFPHTHRQSFLGIIFLILLCQKDMFDYVYVGFWNENQFFFVSIYLKFQVNAMPWWVVKIWTFFWKPKLSCVGWRARPLYWLRIVWTSKSEDPLEGISIEWNLSATWVRNAHHSSLIFALCRPCQHPSRTLGAQAVWPTQRCDDGIVHKRNPKTSQELRMLSSVTINCQVTKIVMNSGSQLSEL